MSSLHTMNLALVDMEDRLTRELQFTSDSRKQVRDAFVLVSDALENLERVCMCAFDERMRALSTAIGNGAPLPETVDHAPEARPAISKRKKEEATDAE